MAYIVRAPRVGRSQGAVIFWGLVSAFFATAFCYYFLKNRTNEENARTLREQVMILQGERDSLSAERDKIQTAAADTEKQLHAREDFLQEKETKLADEESKLDSMGIQSDDQSSQKQDQAAVVKKFDDTVRKLTAKSQDADVVVRGGRPVLRVPSSMFFSFGESQLKPEGKTMLANLVQALSGQTDNFELRIETFTDTAGETPKTDAAGPAPAADQPANTGAAAPSPAAKPGSSNAWQLTATRAAAIAHFLRDLGTIPFQDIIATGRGDFQPIVAGDESHARNRRVEITITPLPPSFHGTESAPKSPRAKPVNPGTPAPAVPPDNSQGGK